MKQLWKTIAIYLIFYFFVAGFVVVFALFRMNMGPDMAFLLDPDAAEKVIKHETVFFWKNLFLWDANWYKQIVTFGYTTESSAFFPLYPLILFISQAIFQYLSVAAAVVSIAGLAASLYYLLRLCEIHAPEKKHSIAILLFLFSPTAFYLLAPFTETVFVPLLLAGTYYLETKQPWKVFLVGVLLGLTRVPGFLFGILPLYYVAMHWKEKKHIAYALSIAAPIMGIVLYGFYLYVRFGNFFQFMDAQKMWRRNYSLHAINILNRYKEEWLDVSSVTTLFHPKVFVFSLDAFCFSAALVAIIFMFFKWRKDYALLCAALIVLPALTGTFSSMPRFILPIVPFFILFFHKTVEHDEPKYLLIIASAIAWTVLCIMFVNLYWIA